MSLYCTCDTLARILILSLYAQGQVQNNEHIKKLEAELASYKTKLNREKEAMDTVIKLRLEKEDLKAELESARDNILYKAQTVWLPRAQESFRDLSSLAGDHLTNGTYSCALCLVADSQNGARLSHKMVSITSQLDVLHV